MTSPHAHSTWAGVVKGQPPPAVSPGPSPPSSSHLLQLYKDCVARGTWARLIFETKGGEEELSFSCRVLAGAATSKAANEATAAPRASKKQGKKRPANKRRRERARRRRQAWEERRRWPVASGSASGGAAAVIAATGEARSSCRRQEQQRLAGAAAGTREAAAAGASVAGRSRSCGQERQPRVRSSSPRQEQQPSKEAAAINRSGSCSRSSSRQQEQHLSAGAAEAGVVEAVASSATSVDAAATATAATAAIREKTKVAVLERRAGARAQTLARIRGSEASDVLRSPEPAMPELEISWMTEEREEQEEEECGKKLELYQEPPLPQPNEEQECQTVSCPGNKG